MHLLTLTLPSLLLLLLTTTALALPQPQQPQPRDPCGPKTQSPSDPKDTCTSTPPLVSEPAAFGVFPFSSITNNTTNTEPTNNNNKNNNNKNTTHPACTLAANNLCTTLSEPGIRAEQWYFETAVSPETAVEGRQACQVGFWPPGEEGAVEGLVEGQCGRVFGAVVEGVGVGGGEGASGVKEGGGREGASVNLVRGPVGVEGMWIGEGGEGEVFTGMCLFFLVFLVLLGFFSFGAFGTGTDGWRGIKKKKRDGNCCMGHRSILLTPFFS